MFKCKIEKNFFKTFLIMYLVASLMLLIYTPFTQAEANVIFNNHHTITNTLLDILYPIFDNNLIRLPFFLLSIVSLVLFNKLLKLYFKEDNYRYLSLFLYLLTPGVLLSFVIVNYATIPILLIIIFIYAYKKSNLLLQFISIVLLFFTNTAQFAFYLAIIIYSYNRKDWKLFVLSLIAFIFTAIESNYPIDGIPRGHLIELFGIYGAVFSPLFFIAVIYSVYRIGLKGKKDVIWHIVTIVFLISIILSIRQKIIVTDFTPYIVIASPIVVEAYRQSISIRLKKFKTFYYKICYTVIAVLLLESSLIVFHYPIYKILHKQVWLIDESIYKIEKSVKMLEKKEIKCINNINNHDINLYKYYHITKCK